LGLIHWGPLRETTLRRYVSHPVECVEVVMFCGALGALGAKLWGYRTERRASRLAVLPPWDGQAVAVTEAGKLMAELNKLPRKWQSTLMVKRAAAILDFLCRRGSAAELDDHIRTLSDNDALALEGSYSLTRFITWAIPILGFLGTVLGITGAISGVTPEVLEHSLSTVTDGLALAFDTTALALGLTMATMFFSFLVERGEQGVLDVVDCYTDRELAHRFVRAAAEGGEFVEVVRRNTDVLLQACEQLVQRQTTLWTQALEESDRRRLQAEQSLQDRLSTPLEAALERTLQTHAQRLAALNQQTLAQDHAVGEQLVALADAVREAAREQQAALAQVAEGVARQVQALSRLQDGESHLCRLQETLNQNLAALAGAGAFEQAVHSLAAAIHLLTARSQERGPWGMDRGAKAPRPTLDAPRLPGAAA
jgi:biopolymer transport protein ExbB/TolQ